VISGERDFMMKVAQPKFGPENGGDTFLRSVGFGLHGTISQKMATFRNTAVRTSNPTWVYRFLDHNPVLRIIRISLNVKKSVLNRD
jgi:hypothetical protein